MIWKIAIDGPAGAGKTTIAKKLSSLLSMEYLDTGAMYRAITLKALRKGINLENEEEYQFVLDTSIDFQNGKLIMDGQDESEEIRSVLVTKNASLVASFKIVRERLVSLQRKMADKKSVVMDGRDIGTVVLPNANLKVFLVATPEIRAKRRLLERQEKGDNSQTLEEVIAAIKIRDQKDSTRKISPLRKAEDAIELDTSNLDIDGVIEKILCLARGRGMQMEDVKNNESMNEQKKEEKVESTVAVEENKEEKKEEKVESTVAVEENKEEKKEKKKKAKKAEKVVKENDAVDTAGDDEEESESKKDVELKNLEVVEGVVVAILPQKAEYKDRDGNILRKAKKGRVVVKMDKNGKEGLLFANDVPDEDVKDDEELFDEFIKGDRVRLVVKKVYPDGGRPLLSAKLLIKREELEKYEEDIKNQAIFNANVVKKVASGYVLEYQGISCLLPTSQVLNDSQEREIIGTEIEVSPIRIDRTRIRLIVSEKLAKIFKRRQDREEFMKDLKVGSTYEGIVKNIESYGAFVELGSRVEGLLHISEVEHHRIMNVEKVFNVGDVVKVEVVRIDENGHIGLSRKSLLPNHWADFTDNNEVDNTIKGKVAEVNRAGIVVNLNDHVQGFLPKSEYSWDKSLILEDVVKVGDEIESLIIELDSNKQRIILSRKRIVDNPWTSLSLNTDDVVECTVVKVLEDGVRFTTNGVSGYLPKSNFGNRTKFEEGEVFNARVRFFDPEKYKIFVTLREKRERFPQKSFRRSNDNNNRRSNGKGSFNNKQEKLSNTFGDYINLEDFK